MALYALGDLHLSFQVNKPMERFGSIWKHHERKIEKYVNQMVKPEDTLVFTGDHSWGRNLEECREDLAFIERLPGWKILLRGNHDMFWDAKKTAALNREYAGRLFFLQNNFATYRDYALVGTKGYTFEGPFYLDRTHCHGESRFGDSIQGIFHDVRYLLVSGDYLDFRPALVLP